MPMKTYLVYSKKQIFFISSLSDVSDLVFVKYGFNWLYALDIANILYSIWKKFYFLAILLIVYYTLAPQNVALQFYFLFLFGFLAYIFEGISLKRKKYLLIATIEAKNASQARKYFMKEYILHDEKKIFVKL